MLANVLVQQVGAFKEKIDALLRERETDVCVEERVAFSRQFILGIPTFAVSGIFMYPDEMFAHGLIERVPIKAFYDALDHWSIIIKDLAGE